MRSDEEDIILSTIFPREFSFVPPHIGLWALKSPKIIKGRGRELMSSTRSCFDIS